MTDPLVTITTVTPAMAQQWLESNSENRSLRRAHVIALARDMREGLWRMTYDPIRFDVRGVLIDGQHRLSAIVLADVSIEMVVVTNLDTAVRDVVDAGLKRTAGDVLNFADIKSGSTVAAVLRVGMNREDGYHAFAHDTRKNMYTSAQILEYAQLHPGLVKLAQDTKAEARQVGLLSSAWGYARYILASIDQQASAVFVNSIVNSSTEGLGDPRLALINYARRNSTRSTTKGAAQVSEVLYATFRSWNAWRDGERLTGIQTGGGLAGPMGARMPTPR